MKKLVLIDSNALVHRAFHALPPLNAPDGKPTNAIYGFMSLLLKMIAELKPDSIIATFDLPGPTFRHEQYEEYKATRIKAPDELYAQIPPIKELLAVMGIPVCELKGFEADDIIGTLATKASQIPGLQTIIMTGDLDTLQLVHGQRTIVFTLRKGMTDTMIYDEDAVRERYGLAPEQVIDFKGLKGDPSDNIPGVKGIGDKTASALIGEFGSIEALYEAIEGPQWGKGRKKKTAVTEKLREKLLTDKESAIFSKKLSTIVTDAPIELDLPAAEWRTHLDLQAVHQRCRDLGFNTLAKRIDAITPGGAAASTSAQLDFDGSGKIVMETQLVATADELPEAKEIALHAIMDNEVVRTLYAAVPNGATYRFEAPLPETIEAVLMRYPSIVAHDLKPLVKCMREPLLLRSHELFDTEIAAWLLNPHLREYPLELLTADLLAQRITSDQAAWASALFELKLVLHEKLKATSALSLFTDLEMPLIPILAAMERMGIAVDRARLEQLAEEASREVTTLEKNVYKLAEGEFNLNSPAQLSEVLFTKLGLRGKVRKTGGGAPSTAAAELEKLRNEHPIIDLILQYRELAKLKTTYIDPFPALLDAQSRVHTTYHQTGTATGRLSSINPNLQNIPNKTALGLRFRSAFVAEPGWKLVSLDYSQLELRLVAPIARGETMIEAFRRGDDIHTLTASEIFGVAPAQITKDMRNQAKVLNFGIIYGMGSMGFAQAADVSRDTAKKFIEEYFRRFSGVAAYMERTKEEAFKQGWVETLYGRRRPLPDITSTMPQLQAAAERMAINHPVQGTESDLMKVAMIRIADHVKQQKLGDRVRMLLQVHDELVFEVREDTVTQIVRELPAIMEQVRALDVPLVVDAKVGSDWTAMEHQTHA